MADSYQGIILQTSEGRVGIHAPSDILPDLIASFRKGVRIEAYYKKPQSEEQMRRIIELSLIYLSDPLARERAINTAYR